VVVHFKFIKISLSTFLLCAAFILFQSCLSEKIEKPIELHWDRDSCSNCRMVISDKRFAAQVIGENNQVYKFDDIGCAVHWINSNSKQAIRSVWVKDISGEKWLNAKTAFWEKVEIHSPMGHNFCPRITKTDHSHSYQMMTEKILNDADRFSN
jgi:copper chaperone NosL